MPDAIRSAPFEQVGQHLVESEGDDLLILRVHGEVDASDARRLIEIDREQAQRNGYSLILIDGRDGGNFGADARKAMFAEMERHPGYLGSTAMFGMTGAMALMLKLVLRAVALLARHYDDEMRMFTTEQEARAFLVERRPLRKAQAAQRRA